MVLQTKTFTKAGNKGYGLKLVLTENSTSVTANTSSVSYSFSITRGSTGFYASQPFSWNITIGGQTIAISGFRFQISTSDPAEQLIKSGTVTVAHNSDGKKTLSFSVSTPDASGISPTYGPAAMSMTGEWALTTIPRASTVTAGDANIGSVTTIKISRASSAFTHTLTYAFGSLSGTIATKTGDTTLSWTVPTSFYAQIPKAKSGKCTITCQTFSGSTLIGTTTASFQAQVPGASAPAVTGTVADTNTVTKSLTGNSQVMVRYFSNALCTISAQGKNSATITEKKIGETVVTGTTRTISGIEVNRVTFSATDSRGFTTRVSKTFSLVPYVKLTANGTVKRDTPTGSTGKLTLQGNYFNASFGAQSNTLTVQYRLQPEDEAYGDWKMITVTLDGNTYRAAVSLTELDYRKAYGVQVQATDKLMTTTADLTLLPGTPVFDWGKNDFRFRVPVVAGGRTVQIDSDGGLPVLYLSRDDNILGGVALSNSTNRLYLFSRAANTGKDENYVIDPADPNLAAAKSYYLLTSKIAPDYVIAQGSSGNWRWRKWNSGVAECWQRYSYQTVATVGAGNIFFAPQNIGGFAYPFEFIAKPTELVSCDGNIGGWYAAAHNLPTNTTTETGYYNFFSGLSRPADYIAMNIHEIGRWK